MSRSLGSLVLLAGLLLLAVSSRVGADPVACTEDCTQTSVGYICFTKQVSVYEQTDCWNCEGGVKGWQRCQGQVTTGGKCMPTSMEINVTMYPSGFEVCSGACNQQGPGGSTPPWVEGMPDVTKGTQTTVTRYTCQANEE
jgi:hypothetical protein